MFTSQAKSIGLAGLLVFSFLIVKSAYAETAGYADPTAKGVAPGKVVKPYRTFVTIQRYSVENNGEPGNSISNVRLEIAFPNGSKVQLPEGGQFWPIGNGQIQEINRTFELPFAMLVNDGFSFTIQMVRKGSEMLPCKFDVGQMSQFNRAYTCHTDVSWQVGQKFPENKIDREGIQIRVYTDLNSKPNEIPADAIALK